jgi:hypothetical protein
MTKLVSDFLYRQRGEYEIENTPACVKSATNNLHTDQLQFLRNAEAVLKRLEATEKSAEISTLKV